MRILGFLFLALLLISGAASAQDAKGWLGADSFDVTKAEADKLGWDAPHGAKLGVVASGSPAENVGLKAGDIVVSLDGFEPETAADLDKSIAAKPPGSEVRMRVLSGGHERRITVKLAERPKVQAAQDQGGPLLMLDTGGHMAVIRGLTFTPDGKQLVSAGDDKVIRIWDWRAGKTVRTIRGRVGAGSEGKIYAMALSPDGRWLAAGGFVAPGLGVHDDEVGSVRLYDFASGRLVAMLKGHGDAINGLAFSQNSKLLISGSWDRSAIIWDVESRKPLHHLVGHTAEIYGVAFTPDGARAVTGGFDQTLRLWRVSDGGLIAELRGHKEKVRALAVRSSDSMIASGDLAGEIRLWDGKDGHFLRTLGYQASQIGALTFSPDGLRLVSTCGGGPPCAAEPQIVWDVASGNRLQQPRYHDNIVLAAAVSPDGRLAATAGGSAFPIHVWDLNTGAIKQTLVGTGAQSWAVGFSTKGQRIAWGRTNANPTGLTPINKRGPIQYELRLPSGTQGLGRPERVTAAAVKDFVSANPTFGTYALSHRAGGNYGYDSAILDLKEGNKLIVSIQRQSTDGYRHLGYTFTPNGQTIISAGGNGNLIAYNLKGQNVGNFIGHEGDVWAVATSPDGEYLISGSADQTVRLWNLNTRELIVTLFGGTDGEWVMWTPQGYYTGSPGADKNVGWQINKSSDQVPDYVGAEQLRQHLNRPDIVERAIILASAEQAVHEAAGTTFTLADLLARPVPRMRIVSPTSDAVQHGGRAAIKIAIEATPDPVKAIRVQVNGRQVEEETPDIGSGGFGAGERLLDVPLANGMNEVRITLTNAIGERAETLTLKHEGDGALDKRGTLYLVAVGVDKYPGLGNNCGDDGKSSCDLAISGADARAIVAAVEKRLGPAHDRIVERLLVNGTGPSNEPTATNILDAIDVLKAAKETDTVLLFIAGHGYNDGPNYRFLATNATWDGPSLRGSTIVPWYALQEAVEAAKGRRILFIDTCHSGNAYNQRLGNAAYHANIIAYTAARFDQESLEDTKLGHGLFTYAVVEGLEGKGALAGKNQISTKELADFVIRRVEALAKARKEEQEPQYFKGQDAEDYVLAHW